MANFIDKSYFITDITLPKSSFDDIESFVERFEREVLQYLLGFPLYLSLINNKTVEPYKSLIDGAEYEVSLNGITYMINWSGLRGTAKQSLIAYYVYCEYMSNKVTSTQSVGETKSIQENSSNVGIVSKVLSAYVKFEELYGYNGQSVLVPSAYNYLKANLTDFPNWYFTELKGGVNSHDL